MIVSLAINIFVLELARSVICIQDPDAGSRAWTRDQNRDQNIVVYVPACLLMKYYVYLRKTGNNIECIQLKLTSG